MKVITFKSGYIVAETEEIEKHIFKLVEDDNLWEYISILISNDLKGKESHSDTAIDMRLDSIESLIKGLTSKLENSPTTVQTMQIQTPAPAPVPDSAKPAKPKKAKVSGKGNKGFLAAAQKASSFR